MNIREKLAQIAETAKLILLYIVTPFAMIAGAIYYLITKNNRLEDEIKGNEAAGNLKESKDEQEKVDGDAATALNEYEQLRGAYVPPGSSGVRPGRGSSEKANRDS